MPELEEIEQKEGPIATSRDEAMQVSLEIYRRGFAGENKHSRYPFAFLELSFRLLAYT